MVKFMEQIFNKIQLLNFYHIGYRLKIYKNLLIMQ